MAHLLFKHLKILLVWGLVFAALSAGISVLFPKYYSAESTVLIISRDRSVGDPYVQGKSAELIGEMLSRVMQTQDFYNKVLDQTTVGFDKAPWVTLTPRQLRKKWAKNVEAQVVYGTSLLTIRAYSRTAEDAVNLAAAVTQVTTLRGFEYVGTEVTFKVVNNPVATPWGTRPNVLLNSLVGAIVGLVLASVWVVRYKRHHVFGTL